MLRSSSGDVKTNFFKIFFQEPYIRVSLYPDQDLQNIVLIGLHHYNLFFFCILIVRFGWVKDNGSNLVINPYSAKKKNASEIVICWSRLLQIIA